MITHIVLCGANGERGAFITMLQHAVGSWSVASKGRPSLAARAAELVDLSKQHPGALITFSMREAADVIAQPCAEAPAGDVGSMIRAAVPRSSITILLPEGDSHDRWVTLWRDPAGGLTSTGISSRFVAKSIHERIGAWFAFEGHKKIEAASSGPGLDLWVRPHWIAREILPEAFPTPRPAPSMTPEAAADRLSKFARLNKIATDQARASAENVGEARHREQQAAWLKDRIAKA